MLNLSRLKPRFWDHQDAAAGPESHHFSFRRKWLLIVTFTTMVTLTPLLVMTLVDYRLTRQAFESEATMAVSRMISNTWRSASFLLSQRRAALEFVARDNRLPICWHREGWMPSWQTCRVAWAVSSISASWTPIAPYNRMPGLMHFNEAG
jgi:hypothetical protein